MVELHGELAGYPANFFCSGYQISSRKPRKQYLLPDSKKGRISGETHFIVVLRYLFLLLLFHAEPLKSAKDASKHPPVPRRVL